MGEGVYKSELVTESDFVRVDFRRHSKNICFMKKRREVSVFFYYFFLLKI